MSGFDANLQAASQVQSLRAQELLTDYRLTPATLMARIDPTYITSKWVLYLSWKIAQCVSRGSCGLLISAPPRHGKSRLATVATPLWVLENFPQYMTGVVTYGEDLSTDFSREIRDNIVQNPNLLSVRLRQDVTRVANFLTTSGGGLKAVGLRGTITGRGFNVLVIDDYIKEPKEAESAAYLEGLYTWYQTVARTRLEPGAVIIIVATRWVKNDLHGKLMKLQEITGRNFFEMVSLPALAYDHPGEGVPKEKWPYGYPDPLGRAPGEALFPERYSQEDMENMKAEMQGRWWNAMFQQNPVGDEGQVIDTSMFNVISKEEYQRIRADIRMFPHNYVIGRYWDFASSKNRGDYTVGARAILHKNTQMFTIDSIVRGQYGAARSEAVFEATSKQDYDTFGSTFKFGMECEPGSSGQYALRHFNGILGKVRPGAILVGENASRKGSKLLAAGPYIGAIERGQVNLLDAEWRSAYVEEIESFPEGLKDDQVDASSGCYRLVKDLIGKSATWGSNPEVQTEINKMRAAAGISPEMASRVNAVWGADISAAQQEYYSNIQVMD